MAIVLVTALLLASPSLTTNVTVREAGGTSPVWLYLTARSAVCH